jgi:hypothetical protein
MIIYIYLPRNTEIQCQHTYPLNGEFVLQNVDDFEEGKQIVQKETRIDRGIAASHRNKFIFATFPVFMILAIP